jgi:manganese transport protein
VTTDVFAVEPAALLKKLQLAGILTAEREHSLSHESVVARCDARQNGGSIMTEADELERIASLPFYKRIPAYFRYSGPGFLQSAMTLGGGTAGACLLSGSLYGYKLLWVQPVAMLLGVIVMSAIAHQTLETGERPYRVFWTRLHPALALLWAVSALVATVIWHFPQYGLATNAVTDTVTAFGAPEPNRWLIAIPLLVFVALISWGYSAGKRGIRIYEVVIKVMVWGIVLAFAVVAFSTPTRWREVLRGFFCFYIPFGDPQGMTVLIGGLGAAVGINMLFLYPYSLLARGWGKHHKGLAYFDLVFGMLIPFMIATSAIIIATANVLHQSGEEAVGLQSVIPVFSSIIGARRSALLLGCGLFAVAVSSITTHMLASGFICCEMFGKQSTGWAYRLFSLVPAVGVAGAVMSGLPFWAAVFASSLAVILMPAACICFMILQNKRSYLGAARPVGAKAWLWNAGLALAILAVTVAGVTSLGNRIKGAVMSRRNSGARSEQSESHAAPSPVTARRSCRAMATNFEIILYGEDTIANLEAAANEALEEIQQIDKQMSLYVDTSDVRWINANAAREPVPVEPGLFSLLETAVKYSGETDGAFDITVGPLARAWGFFAGEGRVPSQDELDSVLSCVGTDHLSLDAETRTITFDMPEVEIDLGGIAKGYGVDCAGRILRKCGIESALINGGTSTIFALGSPPGQNGWEIGIQDPTDRTRTIETVRLSDAALSTSGSYEKFFSIGDKLYCHIIDPRRGYPVEGMFSATAIAPTATASDALSTAFFVLGVEATRTFCASRDEVRAILVPENKPGAALELIRIGW